MRGHFLRGKDGGGPVKFLSDDQLGAIDAHLTRLLDRVLRADGLTPLNDILRAFVLAGGKRVRPQLCVWTFLRTNEDGGSRMEDGADYPARSSIFHPPSSPSPVLDVACAWELFHAFLLAHDDIIDRGDRRRDQPSLHRQLSALDSNCPRFGMNLGIVAGDLLFGAAISLLHELDLPSPDAHRRVLRLFSRVACTTGFGQAIDICQSHAPIDAVREETLLREYHWKTAAYTFEGPMLSGAILAGADDAAQRAISRYALALGQAYQLHNDLIDLARPASDGCDLMEGKRTVTLLRARATMPAAQRERFDERLHAIGSANGHAVEIAESLRRELTETGAVEETTELIRGLFADARGATGDAALPASLACGMRGVLGSLDAGYFAHA
jgi:geranylgeranyl diphosphate synthase type I